MLRMALMLMLAVAYAAGQTVEGSVVDYFTGNGIGGAKVELVPMGNVGGPGNDPALEIGRLTIQLFEGKTAYSAVTDAQGGFRVEGVNPGVYSARYSAAGYASVFAIATTDPEPPRRITVGTNGNPLNLEGRMIRVGKISGRVVDDKGRAVARAQVKVRTGVLAGGLDTDANGRFQDIVMPGTPYTLVVSPPPGLKAPDPEPETGRVLGWAPTYYPGVTAEDAAQKIVVPPGGEMDIELKLAALPTHAVRGVLLKPDGRPAAKMTVTLQENVFTRNFVVVTNADGTFEFPAVVDGNWWLLAMAGSGDTAQWAVETIEVTGHDLDGVKLTIAEVFTVAGKVVMETPKGWTAPKAPPVRLVPVGGRSWAPGPPVVGFVDDDGNFQLMHAYPGLFRLDSTETIAGYYLGEVRLGRAEIAGLEVRLSPGVGALTLVYKADGGTVRGTVENCAGGGVLLVPQDAALRGLGSEHRARCDDNGRYEIRAVRPGDYYAVAVAGNPLSPMWMPEFDEGLRKQASEVTVGARETVDADLSAVRVR
jgi:hypothetical protein